MKIGKVELTKEKLIMAIFLAITITALMVHFVFYAPLLRRLKTEYSECKSIENEVSECRDIIETAGKVYTKRILIREGRISRLIDELTKSGKLEGINFVSINPEKIREDKKLECRILPIRMEIESTYEQLGAFLGSLDKLEKGIVTVKSFNMVSDEENPSGLMTNMVVYTYISGEKDAK